MKDHVQDQKRIAKNTVMLYIRMILIMIVSLYTTRVVLNVLGESDYGIYNIVGSVVVSMIFIQHSLMSATQRFLSYEMGLEGDGNVAKVFSSSLNLHVKFIIVIFILLETVGLWFLNRVLDIPLGRMYAANLVYQFSILTFCLNMIRIPYNAVIISFENMNIYAVLSIAEAILKLSIAVALKYCFSDKLIAYGVLVFVITLIVNSLYIFYCRHKYQFETKTNFKGDKVVIKKLQSFLGWNLLGGVTGVATQEGPNYFMNYYLGVTVNAAMGVAKQVSGAIYSFATGFQNAFNPQIVKAYASKDNDYLYDLIIKTSLLSFYLLFLFAFPIINSAEFIFDLWLVDVPDYTIVFCILIILSQFVSTLSSPLWMVAHATGDIKVYQIVISILSLLVIPISYFVLALHYPPYYILLFQVILNIAILIYRLLFARSRIGLSIRRFIKDVVLKCIYLSLLIVPIPLLLSRVATSFWQNSLVFLFTFIVSGTIIYFKGLDEDSKMLVRSFVKRKICSKEINES